MNYNRTSRIEWEGELCNPVILVVGRYWYMQVVESQAALSAAR